MVQNGIPSRIRLDRKQTLKLLKSIHIPFRFWFWYTCMFRVWDSGFRSCGHAFFLGKLVRSTVYTEWTDIKHWVRCYCPTEVTHWKPAWHLVLWGCTQTAVKSVTSKLSPSTRFADPNYYTSCSKWGIHRHSTYGLLFTFATFPHLLYPHSTSTLFLVLHHVFPTFPCQIQLLITTPNQPSTYSPEIQH